MDTKTQLDRLTELTILHRAQLKQLAEQLPGLREEIVAEFERRMDEAEPQFREELEAFAAAKTTEQVDAHALRLKSEIDDIASEAQKNISEKVTLLMAQKQAIGELIKRTKGEVKAALAAVPDSVQQIVGIEAEAIRTETKEQLRTHFETPRFLNPRGVWKRDEVYEKLDLVSSDGSSYVANERSQGVKPGPSKAEWTTIARRGSAGALPITTLGEIVGTPTDGEILIGDNGNFVRANLTAGYGVNIITGPGSIEIETAGFVIFEGTWNASTNTPALASGVGIAGHYYVVSTAGTTNLDGVTDWQPGDWAIFNGTAWEKVDNSEIITSVNGQTGVVVLTKSDVGLGNVSNDAQLKIASNLSDLNNTATARTNLGLGDSAVLNVGTGAGTVAAGDDARLSDARTPTAHAASHVNGTDDIQDATASQKGLATAAQITKLDGITAGANIGITQLTGDVTAGPGGDSQAATIANDAVTFAKMQNIGSEKLIGRHSSGNGDPEQVGIGGGLEVNGANIRREALTGDITAPAGSNTTTLANTAVTPAAYGSATQVGTFTVDSKGRLTAAGNTNIAIANTAVSGLGTMSTQAASSVAITGGAINGTTIGASTASTGAFTTASASTSLTTPSVTNAGTLALSATGANILTAATNGVERMRITSGGKVGIGTATPVLKLDVQGDSTDVATVGGVTTVEQIALFRPSNDVGGIRFGSDTASGDSYIFSANSGSAIKFGTRTTPNNNVGMTILSSGNVGIGTTTPAGRLQVTETNRIFDSLGNLNVFTSDAAAENIGGSIAFGGNNSTGGTSPYVFAKIQGIKEGAADTWNGALVFGTTAGSSAITERMRITSAGNVGIGTTTPGVKLDVAGAISATGLITGTAITSLRLARAGENSVFQVFQGATDTTLDTANTSAVMILATQGNERTRISSTGLAVTGALSATGKFTLNGSTAAAVFEYAPTASTLAVPGSGDGYQLQYDRATTGEVRHLAWSSAGTAYQTWYTATGGTTAKRMELTSTGLAVTGTLSSTSSALFNGAASTAGIDASSNSSVGQELRSDNASLFFRDGAAPLVAGRRTNDGELLAAYRSTTQVGHLNVTTTTFSLVSTSDARLKENVRPLPNSGAIIDGLKPSLFDWKTGEKNTYGFVAQDTFAVFPQAVVQGDDDPETITKNWSMDQTQFISPIVAELQSLRARVAALESA